MDLRYCALIVTITVVHRSQCLRSEREKDDERCRRMMLSKLAAPPTGPQRPVEARVDLYRYSVVFESTAGGKTTRPAASHVSWGERAPCTAWASVVDPLSRPQHAPHRKEDLGFHQRGPSRPSTYKATHLHLQSCPAYPQFRRLAPILKAP